jgi:hypothetical protein
VYFSVQCTISQYDEPWIVFDRVLVNAGNAWNKAGSVFTAPYTGNYFFSLATASLGNGRAGISLFVNGTWRLGARVFDDFARQSGATIVRFATMLSLSVNNVVWFKSYYKTYSTTDGLTNAQGFYYSPVGAPATAVAWSVTRNNEQYLDSTSLISFNTILVNMQNVWNNATNEVTIPVAGMYLIDLSIGLCEPGYFRTGGELSDV